MKKVVRLTESDLTRIIKRVIEEQSTTQKIDYEVLQKFLFDIDTGGTRYASYWELDSNNPRKRGRDVVLSSKDPITVLEGYLNKPLVWSLVVNGKKEDGAIFEIFSSNGKLYYQVYSSTLGKPVKNEYGVELTDKTVDTAIKRFNQRVLLQEPY